MRKMICGFALCLATAMPTALADEPKLINERRVFEKSKPKWKIHNYQLWSMRLSPDGKTLLYPQGKEQPPLTPEGVPDRQKATYEMVLRNLASGNETVLPINPIESGWRTVFTQFNMFDSVGTKLVLSNINVERRKHDGGAGGATAVRINMKIALYDIPTGKLTVTGVEGPAAIAKFGRSDKDLIVVKSSGRSLDLYTASFPRLELKPLKTKGLLQGICPTADVICIWTPPSQSSPQRLFLYDIKTDKEIIDLPVNQRNRNLDDWETQWTKDGRYLYYHDVKEDPIEPPKRGRQKVRPIARVWDRTAGKQAGQIFDAIPIGPGPTPTTMVLAKRTVPRSGGILLHDAKTGQEYPLGDSSIRLIHAWGSKVLYVKKSAEGTDVLYVAEIDLGTDSVESPKPRSTPAAGDGAD